MCNCNIAAKGSFLTEFETSVTVRKSSPFEDPIDFSFYYPLHALLAFQVAYSEAGPNSFMARRNRNSICMAFQVFECIAVIVINFQMRIRFRNRKICHSNFIDKKTTPDE